MQSEYTQIVTLAIGDCDASGCWKPSGILSKMQDIGEAHSGLMGFSRASLVTQGMCWVLYRVHVRMEKYPKLNDTLRPTTWHGAISGLFFPRHHIFEALDGSLLGEATTSWVLFDIARRRVLRPSSLPGTMPAASNRTPPLPPPAPITADALTPAASRVVRYTELDANGHMNNTRYADWMQDWLAETPPVPRLRDFQINYIQEGRLGDPIDLRAHRSTQSLVLIGQKQGETRNMFEIRASFGDC